MGIKNKNYPIIIYAILKKYASYKNPISIQEIQQKIIHLMGDSHNIDRRTIKGHLDTLIDGSAETNLIEECYKTEDNKYYFISPLDEVQVRLIADVLAASKYLSPKESKDLIKEIYRLNYMEMPRFYQNSLKFKSNSLAPNNEVFNAVEQISKAIEQNKKILCTYMEYDINQKLVPRKYGADRIINVHEIIWTANNYYALCIYEDSGKVYFLRIDKMSNVEIVEEPLTPLPAGFDVTQYVSTQPHLFGGEMQIITFLIKRFALDQVVDSFGSAAKIRDYDSENVKVELLSSIETMKVWFIQYCTVVRDIYPEKLQEMVIDSLKQAVQELQHTIK